MKMKLAALATVAVALLWGLPAHASTVSIALGTTSNVIASSASGIVAGSAPFGAFGTNIVSVAGTPPAPPADVLGSTSTNIGGPGTLDVFVTSVDNIPEGSIFLSSFTSNILPAGWTVEEKTWIGPDNMAFGMGTLIGDHTFNAIGTFEQTGGASPANPYSVTAEYIITAPTPGQALSTIAVQAIPEPSSVLLLGMGLLGLGFSLRRKHI
jgi:hypothetical protein